MSKKFYKKNSYKKEEFYPIKIENKIHDDLIKVSVKMIIIAKINMFSSSKDKVNIFIEKVKELFPDTNVIKSFVGRNQYRFKDLYNKDKNNDDYIILAIPCEKRQNLKYICSNLKKIHSEFVDNSLISKKTNKLIMNKKVFYELDLTEFMKKQPEKVYMVGAMYFSDGKYVSYTKENNNVFVYPESFITLTPNPRYVKGSYEDFDKVIKYFDENNFHSKIILPYPIGEDESSSKKIIREIHNINSKASLIIFTLYKPYFMSNNDKTITNIPSVSSVYHIHICNPIREKELENGKIIRIKNEFNDQTLETNNLFEIAKAYILPYLSSLLLKKNNDTSCTDINIYKFFQNLLKYFYLGSYDANTYNNIPNIMNFNNNGEYVNIYQKARPPFYKRKKENKYDKKKMDNIIKQKNKNKSFDDYKSSTIENISEDKAMNAKITEHEYAYLD